MFLMKDVDHNSFFYYFIHEGTALTLYYFYYFTLNHLKYSRGTLNSTTE